jgi:sugar phosphate isomerase/epimerase
MPGEGLLPLGTLLSHAKANGFSGKVIVELDQAELADKDESDTIILHKELIGFARSYLEKAAIKSEDAFKI